MKFPGSAAERVAHVLLQHGAATAADIATELSLSQQAVRRSLTSLEEAGLVQSHERAPFGPDPLPRRGRPSLSYSLTETGRGECEQSYDDLALESLRFLNREFGREAVVKFAQERARRIIAGDNVQEIIASLNRDGYAATVESTPMVEQLCQHHCPVVDAAREFPEICEAETQELGVRLHSHVARLATLAQGDGICTTLIPRALTLEPVTPLTRDEKSRQQVKSVQQVKEVIA